MDEVAEASRTQKGGAHACGHLDCTLKGVSMSAWSPRGADFLGQATPRHLTVESVSTAACRADVVRYHGKCQAVLVDSSSYLLH